MSCSWKDTPCREIAVAADAKPGKSRAKKITSIVAPDKFGRLAKTAFITPAGTLDLRLSPVDEMI